MKRLSITHFHSQLKKKNDNNKSLKATQLQKIKIAAIKNLIYHNSAHQPDKQSSEILKK